MPRTDFNQMNSVLSRITDSAVEERGSYKVVPDADLFGSQRTSGTPST
jgi:hypothetical protein